MAVAIENRYNVAAETHKTTVYGPADIQNEEDSQSIELKHHRRFFK